MAEPRSGMLTREGARLQVLLDLQRKYGPRRGPEEPVILDEQTVEYPWGWVFFYTSRGWRDGDPRYAVGGNAPYLVNRHDGTLQSAGTALPVEDYVRLYEDNLERQSGAWELIISESSDCDIAMMHKIRSALGLSIVEVGLLKRRLPCTVQTGAQRDLQPLCQRLLDCGVRAELYRVDREDP